MLDNDKEEEGGMVSGHNIFELSDMAITRPLPANLDIWFGDIGSGFQFALNVKKTRRNQAKFKLLCVFFPFKIAGWDK